MKIDQIWCVKDSHLAKLRVDIPLSAPIPFNQQFQAGQLPGRAQCTEREPGFERRRNSIGDPYFRYVGAVFEYS